MNIVVMDGQGGGMGKAVIERLRQLNSEMDITAIGTNSIATATMLRAGATAGATGENSVIVAAEKAKVIIAPIGLVIANSLIGEVTPAMAVAVGKSEALKLLIPSNRCNNHVLGAGNFSLTEALEQIVKEIKTLGD